MDEELTDAEHARLVARVMGSGAPAGLDRDRFLKELGSRRRPLQLTDREQRRRHEVYGEVPKGRGGTTQSERRLLEALRRGR